MSKRRVVFAAFAVGILLLILAGGFVSWRVWGENKPCTGSFVTGSAEISHDRLVVLLGDELRMKATLLFCEDSVSVYRETFENLDVSPFNIKSRSEIRERHVDNGFTEWEIEYVIQPLNTVPGRKYAIRGEVTYEIARLPESAHVVSNEVFVASLLSPDITDIRPITTASVKESKNPNLWGWGASALGAVFVAASVSFILVAVLRARKEGQKKHASVNEISARFEEWWATVTSREAVQNLYFKLEKIRIQGYPQELRGELEKALRLSQNGFNDECDVAALCGELKPGVVRLAPFLMNEGR